MTKPSIYAVEGMTCDGCVRAVTNALRRANPAASVHVDLALGHVQVSELSDEAVKSAVERAGFTYRGPLAG